LRVVAGIYKGRRLEAPRGRSTRPTSDKVREAVFSMLGSIEGLRVLDLYAGSGALGIEALSRAAADATLVDSDTRALRALRQNLDQLGVENAHAARVDASSFLRQAARGPQRWDLVFCDPPYRLAHRLGPELDELLPPVISEGARIVCESSHRQPLMLQLPLLTQRRYGDTLITIHRLGKQAGKATKGDSLGR
jgi:16S rRNA (guanine966-N2)-methyltransferase